jgi:uncharacterized protein (TIGR02145 family)
LEVSALSFCEGSAGVTFALSGTDDGQSYELYRDGTTVVATLDGDGSAATFSGFFQAGMYTARTILGGVFCPADMSGIHIITAATATPANSTVNFTAFNPCSGAATGTVWYLTDTRELSNNQTYKVKKLQDGRIWMVQDLKFGDRCNKTAFTGSSSDQTGSKLTSISGYVYGDCMNAKNGSTPSNRGYLYDWAAVIQKAGAYYGGPNMGCSGTGLSANACQGICPAGWHIPTGTSSGEYQALHNAIGGCATNNDNCWDAASTWEGVLGGYCLSNGTLGGQGDYAYYWSSACNSTNYAYYLRFNSDTTVPGTDDNYKSNGFTVRCVRNY